MRRLLFLCLAASVAVAVRVDDLPQDWQKTPTPLPTPPPPEVYTQKALEPADASPEAANLASEDSMVQAARDGVMSELGKTFFEGNAQALVVQQELRRQRAQEVSEEIPDTNLPKTLTRKKEPKFAERYTSLGKLRDILGLTREDLGTDENQDRDLYDVSVSVAFEQMNFVKLEADKKLQEAFVAAVQEVVSREANVSPADVKVTMFPRVRAVAVEASIHPPPAVDLDKMVELLSHSTTLDNALANAVTSQYGMDIVCDGPVTVTVNRALKMWKEKDDEEKNLTKIELEKEVLDELSSKVQLPKPGEAAKDGGEKKDDETNTTMGEATDHAEVGKVVEKLEADGASQRDIALKAGEKAAQLAIARGQPTATVARLAGKAAEEINAEPADICLAACKAATESEKRAGKNAADVAEASRKACELAGGSALDQATCSRDAQLAVREG